VVAIVGSVLAILGLSLVLLSLALVGSRPTPEMPAFLKTIMLVMMALFLGVAIFGVVTGVGLIRLRNWARISALIWAGVSAFGSASTILIVFLMPLPAPPNVAPGALAAIRWIILLVYGLPLLIGIWWLILFNRRPIKSQFAEQSLSADPSIPHKPRCPTPIVVLAWLLIISVFNAIFVLLPAYVPVVLFGHIISGAAGRVVFILSCVLFAVAGVGLLKLKTWSYPLTIGMYLIWLASGVISLLTPNSKIILNSAMSKMLGSMHLPDSGYQSPDYMRYMSLGIFLGLAFCGAVLTMLFYYRKRFLEAAAASNP
jgi:hypothetical protein